MAKFDKATTFYADIERVVKSGSNHLDAIVDWCEKNQVEVESVAPLIEKNRAMVSALGIEASDLNFMKKTAHFSI
jgi:hypothetical protein